MRTNRLTVWLLAASLFQFLTQDAAAFYNAKTGCWPNRDPLFEIAIATPLYFDSFASSRDKSRLAARWEKFLNREESWLTEAEFIVEGQMLSEKAKTVVLRAAANMYDFTRNNPENYFDPNGFDAIAYQDDAFGGHAAIFINGNGYGFGPKNANENPIYALWTTGKTSGWDFVPSPRTATTYVIDTSSPNRSFADGSGKCSCGATWGQVGKCADYFAKTWDGTLYQLPSRTCRTYVSAIVSGCCLKYKSSTDEK